MHTNSLRDASLIRSQCLVDGDWIDADDYGHIEVHDPGSGALLGTVPDAGAAETRRAVEAAARALDPWRAATADERSRILRRWYELIVEHQEDLAVIMTSEQGKPLAEARAEILYAASYAEWFAEETKRTYGDVVPSPWTDKRIIVTKEPIGVCAAITPWNFPSAMLTRKVAPALAAGCTIVVKPASQTPLSALALAALAERAGVPHGVLNVVTGGARAIGAELTSNPIIRKLSFTGSTDVGRVLAAQCAPSLKKMSLELGGNAPFIVFDDADLEQAVAGAIAAKFRNAGQTCVCANRLLVQDGVYDRFAELLVTAVQSLKVGHGMEAGSTVGPLIDESSVLKVEGLLEDALSKGARTVTGGRRHPRGSRFFEPTVVADVTSEMQLAQEEIFGPVAPLMRFATEEEALAIANDTEFGLAAYLYTRDLRRTWQVSDRLEYGMVGVNTGVISTAVAPFGGIKQSGYGREGSKVGIEEYLETKYRCIGGV